MTKHARILASLLLAAFLVSCAPAAPEPKPEPASQPLVAQQASPTPTRTPARKRGRLSIYRAPELSDMLASEAENWGLPVKTDPDAATLHLELASAGEESTIASKATWIYALVAPFPTVTDGVPLDELKATWSGSPSGYIACAQCEPLTASPLWMADSTLAAFTALWGKPADGAVQTVPADQLVDALWENQPSWGIVPFEELVPKLKVLSVDGQSPIHKDFDAAAYPLKADFALRALDREPATLSLAIPNTNREPAVMTTIILTGVTALVRATAYTMETKGVTYPDQDIRDFMRAADITHISNEIPFYHRL